jgi:hypothetical protein
VCLRLVRQLDNIQGRFIYQCGIYDAFQRVFCCDGVRYVHLISFRKVPLSMAADFPKGRKTLEENIKWQPFSLKYSITLDRNSVYSPAFFGPAIATCIASQLVKRTLILSLDGSFTLFGEIEIVVPSDIASMISSFISSHTLVFDWLVGKRQLCVRPRGLALLGSHRLFLYLSKYGRQVIYNGVVSIGIISF